VGLFPYVLVGKRTVGERGDAFLVPPCCLKSILPYGDKNKTGSKEYMHLWFYFLLVTIFTKNIGLVFLVRTISYMLSCVYVHDQDIENALMLKIVFFSVLFAMAHIAQSQLYIFGILSKMLLEAIYCIVG